jgi:hypothetical protein
LLEDEQMFSLGEFVDGPCNKFPTVKILKMRRVYEKFHAFLILIKFYELCWYFYLQVYIWD